MAATITITCPECDKQIKAPAEVVGKKVRCKACGHVFPVKAPGAPAAKAAAAPPPKPHDEDDEGSDPYGVSDLKLTARCPNCAYEMESEESVICLHCGYNTQSRLQARLKKTHDVTGLDYFLWLLPGISCIIGIILLIVWDIWFCTEIEDLVKDEWYEFVGAAAVRLWQTIGSIFIMFGLLMFAIKRLIFNYTPPEVEKR
jgi:DNA-directed RNA polymerase subunit M/transcription elongation factor TFIIS